MTVKRAYKLLFFILLIVPCLSCELGWLKHGDWCYYKPTEHNGTEELLFEAAGDRCRVLGAELASVLSVKDEYFLASILKDHLRMTWIGLSTLHGKLGWTDGTKVDYSPLQKESHDASTSRCYVITLGRELERRVIWLTVKCSEKHPYICKKSSTKLIPTSASTSTLCSNCTRKMKREIPEPNSIYSSRQNLIEKFNPVFSPPKLPRRPLTPNDLSPHLNWPPPIPLLHPRLAIHQRPTNFHSVNRPISHVVVIPHHQGGNVLHLNSLFSRSKDDNSNLVVTKEDSPTTPQTIITTTIETVQDISPGGLDHQQSTENVETARLTTPSDVQVTTTAETTSPSQSSSQSPSSVPEAGVTRSVMLRQTNRFQLPEPTSTPRRIVPAEKTTMNAIHYPRSEQSPTDRSDTSNLLLTANGCYKSGDLFFKDSCYFSTSLQGSYYESLEACKVGHPRALNPTPVQIDNSEENAFLVSTFDRRSWIGLHKKYHENNETTYEWINTGVVPYTYWANNEPATSVGDCVYASGTRGNQGQWFVDQCEARHPMICEYTRIDFQEPTMDPSAQHCAEGWTFYELTSSCYKLMTGGGLPQYYAERNCVLFGAHLVSITSKEEAEFIRRMPSVLEMPYTTFWTGLTHDRQGEFRWKDGSNATYFNWNYGQPDYHHGRENCVTAYKRRMSLSDSYCSSYFAYMCKAPMGMSLDPVELITPAPAPSCPGILGQEGWTIFRGHCYKAYSSSAVGPLTWTRAKAFCRKKGGDLLSIADRGENAFILSQVYTLPDYTMWIGGFAHITGGYRWSDDVPFTFINWKKGEPNNYRNLESCVSLYPKMEGYWNDDSCGRELGWVCKRKIGKPTPPPATTPKPTGNCPPQWLNTGKKCIKLFTEEQNYFDARDVCAENGQGGDLVSIHDEKDNAFVAILTGPLPSGSWIGLTYNANYVWVDGTAVEYTNWAPGEPSNSRHKSIFTNFTRHMRGNKHWRHADGPHVFHRLTRDVRRQVSRTSRDIRRPISGMSRNVRQFSPTSEYILQQISNRSLDLSRRKSVPFTPARLLIQDLSEDCIEIMNNFYKGQWNDVRCRTKKSFVCQKPLDQHLPDSIPVPCPPPHSNFTKHLESCYKFIETPKSWLEAQAICRSLQAHLVSIESNSEDAMVQHLAQGSQATWTGLNTIKHHNQFLWDDKVPVQYSNWGDGQPDIAHNTSRCVYNNNTWFTSSCDDSLPFVCKYTSGLAATGPEALGECPEGDWTDLGGKHCYSLETKNEEAWDGANKACRLKASHLLSIHSEEEMDRVKRLTARAHVLWIGLIRDFRHGFVWSDQTPFDYSNWGRKEPSDSHEFCVEMWSYTRDWNDINCDVLRGYVCKIDKIIPDTTVVTPPTTIASSQSPSTVITSPRSHTTLHQQKLFKTESRSSVGGGGTAGIVLACLVLAAAAVLIVYSYRRNVSRVTRPRERSSTSTSFDNVLYNPNDGPDGEPMTMLTSEVKTPQNPGVTDPKVSLIPKQ